MKMPSSDQGNEVAELSSQLDVQVGGSHYKSMAIQPMQYSVANGLQWAEGEVIKYVSRWRSKGGVKDLEKAAHVLAYLIEVETNRMAEEPKGGSK